MRRTLLALMLLTASGCAAAKSSVTITVEPVAATKHSPEGVTGKIAITVESR